MPRTDKGPLFTSERGDYSNIVLLKDAKVKKSYDPRSYGRNFSKCVEKPENFRTTTAFEPVTSR